MAGIYNFTIEQGATFSQVWTYKDSAGAAINLTGYTARMKARQDIASTTAILDLTTENSGISLGGSAGTITLSISATATAALSAPSNLVYDLELVNGSTVTRLVEGSIRITPEVTR